MLAVADVLREVHVELAFLHHHAAARVWLRHAHRNAALAAAVAVEQVDPDPDVVVFAGGRALGAPGAAPRCAGGLAAEQ